MPPWTYLLVEAVAFLFAGLVLREAWKRGARDVATMLVGMGFGLAIEVYFVTQYSGYSYGDFLVDFTLGDHHVPLWVAAGWGTIIYVSMKASDRMGIPLFLRPFLDGLLALSLDLTLDPVAEALGWWNWSRPGQAWGVPYDNFIGWLLIVSSISMFIRLGYSWFRERLVTDILVPVVALIPAVLTVAGIQLVLDGVLYPLMGEPKTWLVVAALYTAIVLPAVLSTDDKGPRAWYLTGVPVAYHGLMVFLLLLTPLSIDHPELILFMCTASVASLTGFRHPSR
jgi:uncharacterized membrane protein